MIKGRFTFAGSTTATTRTKVEENSTPIIKLLKIEEGKNTFKFEINNAARGVLEETGSTDKIAILKEELKGEFYLSLDEAFTTSKAVRLNKNNTFTNKKGYQDIVSTWKLNTSEDNVFTLEYVEVDDIKLAKITTITIEEDTTEEATKEQEVEVEEVVES